MKKILIACMTLAFVASYAQPKPEEGKYRRSSLYTLMINDDNRQHAAVIKDAFVTYPVPDKFNDHNLEVRSIQIMDTSKDQNPNITNYLNKNGVAKSLVAKWFNRSEKGGFNMNLIGERGFYNASEMEASIAKATKRGVAMLADAGEELIGNTFILVSDFKYVSKEEIAEKTKEVASALGGLTSRLNVSSSVSATAGKGLDVAAKGYVVKTTSYLYRLDWNDSIAAVFYNEYWNDDAAIDEKKKKAFDESQIFTFSFIGSEVAWADLQSTIYTKKSEEDLIRIATKKSVDAVIARLQKNHQEFRTKTPLFSVDPLAAKIGLKEGLEGGDKYEVLEMNQDENGRTFYKKMGVISVDKNQIWDNRYMAGEDSVSTVDRTLFKGGKGYYPGMLIKQK